MNTIIRTIGFILIFISASGIFMAFFQKQNMPNWINNVWWRLLFLFFMLSIFSVGLLIVLGVIRGYHA